MTPDEIVFYSGHVFVRTKKPFSSWVTWHPRLGGGPTLRVRRSSFEVSASQGMLLESRHLVIRSQTATMWLDRVGWAGTPFDRKECVHLVVENERNGLAPLLFGHPNSVFGRPYELALTPRDGLERAWQALIDSGVRQRHEIASH